MGGRRGRPWAWENRMVRKLFGLAVAACLVAACGSSGATSTGDASDTVSDTSDRAMDRLDVIILPYITYAPYYIAIEEGYFAEQGIEVEVVSMTGTEEVMPALSSGQVDVASGLISAGMLNAIARGADVDTSIPTAA